MARGTKWCTSGRRPHADLWRRIWHHLQDLGYGDNGSDESVQVRHVKAHVAKRRIADLPLGIQRHTRGNEFADEYAKKGAALDANFSLSDTLDQAGEKSSGFCRTLRTNRLTCGATGGVTPSRYNRPGSSQLPAPWRWDQSNHTLSCNHQEVPSIGPARDVGPQGGVNGAGTVCSVRSAAAWSLQRS